MIKWLKDNLTLSALLTLIVLMAGAYSQLATKSDLKRITTISSFNMGELNIKLNELELGNLDRIKTDRSLTSSEKRKYKAIQSSTERIIKSQGVLLNVENYID